MNKLKILPILSCVGVATTAYLTYRKASEIKLSVQGAKVNRFQNKTWNVKLAKSLIPPLIAGTATCTCILIHGRLTSKQLAAATASAALIGKQYGKYRNKVRELYGKEKDQEIIAEIAKEDWGMSPILPSSDKQENSLFYDSFSDFFFYAPIERVNQAMYHINRNLQLRGDATLEEFYNFIGLDDIPIGADQIGWDISYFIEYLGITPWIDFYTNDDVTRDGKPYKVIGLEWEPLTKQQIEEAIE